MTADRRKSGSNRRYTVVVDGRRHCVWGHYATREEAVAACRALHRHGFLARIVDADEANRPEAAS